MPTGGPDIIHEWVRVKAWDKVLIVTSKEHQAEAKALKCRRGKRGPSTH